LRKPSRGSRRLDAGMLAAPGKLTRAREPSGETVRRRLAENGLNPGARLWCFPGSMANMSPAWKTYRPLCRSAQSVGSASTRARSSSSGEGTTAVRPSRVSSNVRSRVPPQRTSISSCIDAHRPWRPKVKVTARGAEELRQCIANWSMSIIPRNPAPVVAGQPVDPFGRRPLRGHPARRSRRILRRLEFHYTPSMPSWLNMVEIEIGVLRGQCLDRRIDDPRPPQRNRRMGNNEMPPAPAINGCHNRKGPAPKWAALSSHPKSLITVRRY